MLTAYQNKKKPYESLDNIAPLSNLLVEQKNNQELTYLINTGGAFFQAFAIEDSDAKKKKSGAYLNLARNNIIANIDLENADTGANAVLQAAAYCGHLTMVEQLLQIPAVLENAHAEENAALRVATSGGHLVVVERLLQIPAVLENAHAEENAVLQTAAYCGHLAIVERLLQIPVVLENAHTEENAALQAAAYCGHLVIVERLLQIPAVLENAHAEENAVLRKSVKNGHVAVVERLLRVSAVLENIHVKKNAALRAAAKNGHLAIVFAICKIYRSQAKELPVYITVQFQEKLFSLTHFLAEYEQHLTIVQETLQDKLVTALSQIVAEYAEISFNRLATLPARMIINRETVQTSAAPMASISDSTASVSLKRHQQSF